MHAQEVKAAVGRVVFGARRGVRALSAAPPVEARGQVVEAAKQLRLPGVVAGGSARLGATGLDLVPDLARAAATAHAAQEDVRAAVTLNLVSLADNAAQHNVIQTQAVEAAVRGVVLVAGLADRTVWKAPSPNNNFNGAQHQAKQDNAHDSRPRGQNTTNQPVPARSGLE